MISKLNLSDEQKRWFLFGMFLIVSVSFVLTLGVHAEDAFDSVANIFNTFYTKIGVVVYPLGVLAAAICAFKMLIATDEKSVAKSKTSLIVIAAALILYAFAPALIDTVKSLSNK